MYPRWFFVTFSSPSWRSLNHSKGSLNHPKKVTSRTARSPIFREVVDMLGSHPLSGANSQGYHLWMTLGMPQRTIRKNGVSNPKIGGFPPLGLHLWVLRFGCWTKNRGLENPPNHPILVGVWNHYPLFSPTILGGKCFSPYFWFNTHLLTCFFGYTPGSSNIAG